MLLSNRGGKDLLPDNTGVCWGGGGGLLIIAFSTCGSTTASVVGWLDNSVFHMLPNNSGPWWGGWGGGGGA